MDSYKWALWLVKRDSKIGLTLVHAQSNKVACCLWFWVPPDGSMVCMTKQIEAAACKWNGSKITLSKEPSSSPWPFPLGFGKTSFSIQRYAKPLVQTYQRFADLKRAFHCHPARRHQGNPAANKFSKQTPAFSLLTSASEVKSPKSWQQTCCKISQSKWHQLQPTLRQKKEGKAGQLERVCLSQHKPLRVQGHSLPDQKMITSSLLPICGLSALLFQGSLLL